MPSPVKEYRCLAHGPFESRAKAAKCPYGCSSVHWSPRTPPSIRTNQVMVRTDGLMTQLAGEFGLSDMRSKYEGESVMDHRRPDERPSTMGLQDYIAAAAQNKDPRLAGRNGAAIAGMWASPSQIPNAPHVQTEPGQITPLDHNKFATKPIEHPDRAPLPIPRPQVSAMRHRDAGSEVATVQSLAASEKPA